MSNTSTYEQEISTHGKIIYTNVGTSMMPLLRERRDVMIIEKTNGRLKKYDVPLYKRPDGKYVLHRIIKVRKTDYVICGDHCTRREYGITDEHIIGVLTGIIRDGKLVRVDGFRYRLYCHLWCDFFYIRVLILKFKSLVRKSVSYIKRLFRKSKNN